MERKRDKKNFHEAFGQSPVDPPSPRSTGLVFAAVAILAAIFLRHTPVAAALAGVAAAVLLALSLLAPKILQPLNIVWFQFGMLLHRVVNPLVMFLMFAVAFVPTGLIMRLFYDPLRLKPDKNAPTYWLDPDPAELKLSSMKNQF